MKVTFFIFFTSILLVNNLSGQCAGTNNSITICDKESDTSYLAFNLFDQLGGAPQTGGTWESDNPLNQKALDTESGIVDLWRINRFGSHLFTYTNQSCNESATVTVVLGGYPGEDNINGGANVCSDNAEVNLFSFLDNNLTNLSADTNGKWEETLATPKGFLTDQFFNATLAGNGTYTFKYTVDNVDSCSSRFSTITLEVHRIPNPGIPEDIAICATEDFSPYTNINLFDQLTEEDTDGIWSDVDGTNQISGLLDSTINIQEIYNTFGPGTYKFDYTVFQTHGVCSEQTSTVTISIPKIKARFQVEDQCKNNPLLINIQYTSTNINDFSYSLKYELRNASTNELVFETRTGVETALMETELETTSIGLPPNIIKEEGKYIIKATKTSSISGIICTSIEILEDEFTIYDTQTSIPKLCFDGTDATIIISNLKDSNGAKSNDTYFLTYTIKDYINETSKLIENQEIVFTNGEGLLTVDISSFPGNAIDYNLKIDSPIDGGFECIDFDFSAALVPEDILLDIAVDNQCNTKKIEAVIIAPPLFDGKYTIEYIISKDNDSAAISQNTLTLEEGITNYDIDISKLETGNYKVLLKSKQDDTNPCRTEFKFDKTAFFSINAKPVAPTLKATQTFCFNSNSSTNEPRISDITVTPTENLTWYENSTSNTPLDVSTLLIDGEDYFVTSSVSNNGCQSAERASVVITFNIPSLITSNNINPVFCALNNATLGNLDAIANKGKTLWYDAITGGNLLKETTILENEKKYFAVESINNCEFDTRLQFNVSVLRSTKPIFTGTNLLCSLDNLSLFDLEKDLVIDINSSIAWYDSLQGGNEIDNAAILQENINYYATGINTICQSERVQVYVSLSECDPDIYDFFIPDGFSPNGDGANDTFYIPNIQFYYPDYEFQIFNRYGQTIFTLNNDTPEWNGENFKTRNDATTGVYFYILKYNKSNLKPKQGRIYLSK